MERTDVVRIADALERIAAALEAQLSVQKEAHAVWKDLQIGGSPVDPVVGETNSERFVRLHRESKLP